MPGHYTCADCLRYWQIGDLHGYVMCPACGGDIVDLATDRMPSRDRRRDRLVTGTPVVRMSEREHLARVREEAERKQRGR